MCVILQVRATRMGSEEGRRTAVGETTAGARGARMYV